MLASREKNDDECGRKGVTLVKVLEASNGCQGKEVGQNKAQHYSRAGLLNLNESYPREAELA